MLRLASPAVRRGLLALLTVLAAGACRPADLVTSGSDVLPARRNLTPGGGVVISQIYGGGGNAGSTYRSDFVELFNNSASPISVNGWSVQYASAAGTTWQVTTLPNATLPPGGYLLVQQSTGAGGSVNLPTADGTGGIQMSATAGKVALVGSATALSGSCPTGVVDFVGFGTTANCAMSPGGPVAATSAITTVAPSNTNAVLRKDNGATDTNNNRNDFSAGAPNPRNSLSPVGTPGGGTGGTPTPQVTVTLSPSSLLNGATSTATAAVTLSGFAVAFQSITWSTSNGNAAVVSANVNPASITAQGTGTSLITASVVVSGQTYTGSATLTVTTPSVGTMNVSGRSAALPVGYQVQLFVSGNNATGVAQNNASVTWSTNNSAVITVDATGVVTATGPGSARVIVTAADGSSASTTIVTAVAPTLIDARPFNTALGLPTDADPSDDVIIARRQYTLSYNPRRGVSNWAAWNLDATHTTGAGARCNCFTLDTALVRLGLPATTTNDWVNNGEYSRGHLAPSADWTSADGDNAATFFLTNMLPQQQDMNGGPWGAFENFLRTQTSGGRQIYIVAGGIWTRDRSGPGIDGYGVLNGGRLAIPDSMWKIAVVVPDQRAPGQILSASDVQVYAVNMPNIAGVQGVPYTNYLTTVDRIQRSTGYDFLSMIAQSVQCAIEQRSCGPTAAFTATSGAVVGSAVSFNASSTLNPSSSALTYSWAFGNGSTGTGATAQTTYATAGSYTVMLTVSDGVTSSVATRTVIVAAGAITATITPTASGWSAGQPVTVRVGQQLVMGGAAIDPAARGPYRLTWSYGDGTGFATTSGAIPTATRPMNRAKTWTAPGQYTVTFTILNGSGASATATLLVTVVP